jgi:sortase A
MRDTCGDPVWDFTPIALKYRKRRRSVIMGYVATAVTLVLAAACIIGPTVILDLQTAKDKAQAVQTDTQSLPPNGFTPHDIARAHEYNRSLSSDPSAMGEPIDPFGNTKGDFGFHDDRKYWDTLNLNDGIMGTISIPKIGANLVIRHGADKNALDNGVGHLHGTSLPVGGRDTNSVLTGHRGMLDRPLFTRLDEVEDGDPIYIHVGGQVLGYKVDHIWDMVKPTDMSHFAIDRGQDRLTLVTCTPFGVNTHRLIVGAHRADPPIGIPYQKDAPTDRMLVRQAIIAACALMTIAAMYAIRAKTHNPFPKARHSADDGRTGYYTDECRKHAKKGKA